jgi:hypothetical protein
MTVSAESPTISVGNNDYDVTQVVEWIENGTFEEEIYKEFLLLDDDAKSTFQNDFITEWNDTINEYLTLLDENGDAQSAARESDDDALLADLNDIEDILDDTLDDMRRSTSDEQITLGLTSIGYKYFDGTTEIAIGTDMYKDGDKVAAFLNGGELYDYEQAEVELTDTDGDGFITDHDRVASEYEDTPYSVTQPFFLTVGEGFHVEFGSEIDGVLTFYCVNPTEGITIEFSIANITEGNSVIFDSLHEAISDAELAKFSAEAKKFMFLGDSMDSVYVTENPMSEEAQRSNIENFDAIESKTNFEQTQAYWDGSWSGDASAYSVYQECLGIIFDVYNAYDEEGGTGNIGADAMEKAQAEVLQILGEFSDQDKSNMLKSIVLGVAFEGEQADFQRILMGSDASSLVKAYEDSIMVGDELTENEGAVCVLIETLSGSEGLYGGASFMDVILAVDETGEDAVMSDDFGSPEKLSSILSAYQTLAEGNVSWATYVEQPEGMQETLDDMQIEEDYNISLTMSLEFSDAASAALAPGFINAKDGNEATDGITKSEYSTGVAGAIQVISNQSLGTSMEDVAKALMKYFNNIPESKMADDIVAGTIYYLQQVSPKLVRSLVAVDGFASRCINKIEYGNNKPDRMNGALGALSKAKNKLDGYRNGSF